jgi:hypothetical protein
MFLIAVAVLPIIMVMAGCGNSGGTQTAQNLQQRDSAEDWGAAADAWSGAFQPMTDFSQSTRQTMRDQQRSVRQMEEDDKDTFNILNGARKQDNMYRQQQPFGR